MLEVMHLAGGKEKSGERSAECGAGREGLHGASRTQHLHPLLQGAEDGRPCPHLDRHRCADEARSPRDRPHFGIIRAL